MLKITIPEVEGWDQIKEEFVSTKEQTIQLEHSLLSVSKWEAIHHKPFLSNTPKTSSEEIDYFECMCITQNVNRDAFVLLPANIKKQITDYIENPMTATTFSNEKNNSSDRSIITSELIYYWMISSGIPIECEKWHLNRLLTLIKICSIKNSPTKKMSRSEILNNNRALNAARRAKLKSKG